MRMSIIYVLLFFLIIAIDNTWADELKPSNPSADQSTTIYLLGQEPKNDPKKIDGSYEVDANGKRRSETSFTAGVGNTVVVYLNKNDKKKLIHDAHCLDDNEIEKKACTKKNIALYLDGRNIAERKHEDLINPDYIEFKLGYQESNKDKWKELLGSPTAYNGFFEKPVAVMIGITNPSNTSDLVTVDSIGKFQLRRISIPLFVLGGLGLIMLLWIILKLAPETGLLRNGDKDAAWSLARCQMAFWFIVIIYSFLFVWGITWALDTITPQTLVMMGLSSGTLLGAALIDASQDENSRLKEIQVSIEKFTIDNSTLQLQLNAATTANQTAAAAGLKSIIDENNRRINALTEEVAEFKELDRTSGNFWDDILTDRKGNPALHRLQIVAWTIVLGFIFIYSVWKDLTMPSFSDTLLSLMGLSSVTYLGFKAPENKQ